MQPYTTQKTDSQSGCDNTSIKHINAKGSSATYWKLNTIADNFITISDNLKGIDYASTFNKIDSTLYNVQMLTEKLNRKDNSIGLLFNDPTFYQNLSATTANAATLLEDLKAHPKRYVHFSLFGKKDK